MYQISIITVGSLKESYWREAEKEYLKRLTPYAKVAIHELKEEAFKNANDKNRVLIAEAERIVKKIPKDATIILLDIEGTTKTSEAFAHMLHSEGGRGEHIVCIIGGPLGIHESIKSKARYSLSLSRLTFTHQIARILLLEQLYRALTILAEKSYHY